MRELTGLPRHADPRDIRDAFEQAVAEAGIALPDRHLALRFALRRLAARFAAGEAGLGEMASDEWSDLKVETEEERAFRALLPPCACCIKHRLGLDEGTWIAQLRIAARALASQPDVGPHV
ncbi:hypothetical protein [Streptomyces sp. NPDC017940]|uniref:hypothetical protein n=1 Tax=Streptomyces sp. NPDC017940 TaxID=3365017 RepID=UPI0037ADFFDB